MVRISPLEEQHVRELVAEFDRACRAIVSATLLSAVVQGLLAGIGFYFAGLRGSVALLMLLTMVLALVPFTGAAAVWIPVSLYLYFYRGQLVAAIGLAIYGARHRFRVRQLHQAAGAARAVEPAPAAGLAQRARRLAGAGADRHPRRADGGRLLANAAQAPAARAVIDRPLELVILARLWKSRFDCARHGARGRRSGFERSAARSSRHRSGRPCGASSRSAPR